MYWVGEIKAEFCVLGPERTDMGFSEVIASSYCPSPSPSQRLLLLVDIGIDRSKLHIIQNLSNQCT
jgi:hypothetical protein